MALTWAVHKQLVYNFHYFNRPFKLTFFFFPKHAVSSHFKLPFV